MRGNGAAKDAKRLARAVPSPPNTGARGPDAAVAVGTIAGMDPATLLANVDWARSKLLASLDAIEKGAGADVQQALGWRPAPGRAHIAWQAMHCAASLDKILNVRIKGGQPVDATLLADFASGSTPSDANVPDLATIRATLARTFADWRAFVAGVSAAELDRTIVVPNAPPRTVGEWILNMAWHESHHQGQIHLTWNCYQATR